MVLDYPSLLITDDDAEFRDTLQSVFEARGYKTVLARDGEEALEVLQDREIHLALFDLHMPGLSGLDVLRVAKGLNALLPCILMSAAFDAMIRRQAESLAYSLLDKPISHEQLTGTVESAMRWAYDWPPVDDVSP